ncbi:MAG: ParB/RepB/Spo0J family partition protein [Planctomycetes bacterium]|nr:ParB/RepB/Spo0J family partition protein [Planctomycetota bacterium]
MSDGLVEQTVAPPRAELVMVPIDAIEVGSNIRTSMDEVALAQLSESIRELGLLEPVIVHRVGKTFRMIAGHRRLAAAGTAGEVHVKAMVYDRLPDTLVARMQLTENLEREDLNHIDVALELGRAADAGMTVMEIAKQIHKSDDYVRKHLDLLRLCEPVRRLVASGRLPLKQAELLTIVGDEKGQIDLAGRAVSMQLVKDQWVHDEAWNEKEDAPRDYVKPTRTLRDEIALHLRGLAAGGWPMDAGYAGCPPCDGCPHNSESRSNGPMLFAGVHPRHSGRKGFCGNPPCYDKKAKQREKDLDKKRKEAKREQAKKIAKAKKAGLTVCPSCSRVLSKDEKLAKSALTSEKVCAKCVEKHKKQVARGGSWEQEQRSRKTKIEAMKKAFPSTPAEKYAVALWGWGKALCGAIADRLQADAPPNSAGIVLYVASRLETEVWLQRGGSKKSAAEVPPWQDVAATPEQPLPGPVLSRIWSNMNLFEDYMSPHVSDYQTKVQNVPLDKDTVELIGFMETLCHSWHVQMPPRPQEADFRDVAAPAAAGTDPLCNRDCAGCSIGCTTPGDRHERMKIAIKSGKKDEALPAIARCTDAAFLVETVKVCKGDWRRKAIRDRVVELDENAAAE